MLKMITIQYYGEYFVVRMILFYIVCIVDVFFFGRFTFSLHFDFFVFKNYWQVFFVLV